MSQVKDHNPPSRMRPIRGVAEFFGVSVKTVRRWIESGELKAHQLGRQWRIAPEDIEGFLATCKKKHRLR